MSDFDRVEADYWKAIAVNQSRILNRITSTINARHKPPPPEPPVGTYYYEGQTIAWQHEDDGWYCQGPQCRTCPVDWYEVSELYLTNNLVRKLPNQPE
jgi:hypothetical protein